MAIRRPLRQPTRSPVTSTAMASADARDGKFRRIVFTINNYTPTEYQLVTTWKPQWLIVAKEVSASGTPHLQGAAILGKQMRAAGIVTIPGMARAHIEPMRSQPLNSKLYCSKGEQSKEEWDELHIGS